MLAFGTYLPGDSVIHQLNAQVKIILACAFSVSAVLVVSWVSLGALWLATVVCYSLAHMRISHALAGLGPIAVLLLFTVLAHAVTFDASPSGVQTGSMGLEGSICLPGGLYLSFDGVAIGVFFALRIALVIAACSLLSFTTSQMQLVHALQALLTPLRFAKLPVDDICATISIALRFVPLVHDELAMLKRAKEARGMSFEGCGVIASLKAWGCIITPLFVSLFRRADILARAMDARCYGRGRRSTLVESKLKIGDVVTCVVAIAVIIAVVVLL